MNEAEPHQSSVVPNAKLLMEAYKWAASGQKNKWMLNLWPGLCLSFGSSGCRHLPYATVTLLGPNHKCLQCQRKREELFMRCKMMLKIMWASLSMNCRRLCERKKVGKVYLCLKWVTTQDSEIHLLVHINVCVFVCVGRTYRPLQSVLPPSQDTAESGLLTTAPLWNHS